MNLASKALLSIHSAYNSCPQKNHTTDLHRAVIMIAAGRKPLRRLWSVTQSEKLGITTILMLLLGSISNVRLGSFASFFLRQRQGCQTYPVVPDLMCSWICCRQNGHFIPLSACKATTYLLRPIFAALSYADIFELLKICLIECVVFKGLQIRLSVDYLAAYKELHIFRSLTRHDHCYPNWTQRW